MEAGSSSTTPRAKTGTTGEDANDRVNSNKLQLQLEYHVSDDLFPWPNPMDAGSSSSTTPRTTPPAKTGVTGEDADDHVNNNKLQLEHHGSHDGHKIMIVHNRDDERNNRLSRPIESAQPDFEGDASGDANSDAGQEGDNNPIDQNAGEGEEGGRDGDDNADDAEDANGDDMDAEKPEETDLGTPAEPLKVGGWADPKRYKEVSEICPPLTYSPI